MIYLVATLQIMIIILLIIVYRRYNIMHNMFHDAIAHSMHNDNEWFNRAQDVMKENTECIQGVVEIEGRLQSAMGSIIGSHGDELASLKKLLERIRAYIHSERLASDKFVGGKVENVEDALQVHIEAVKEARQGMASIINTLR